jgi:hypothetical protein
MQNDNPSVQRLTSALARLGRAIEALEEAHAAQTAATAQGREELTSTRAELAELRLLHATACSRLDAAIVRLRTVVDPEVAGDDLQPGDVALIEGR